MMTQSRSEMPVPLKGHEAVQTGPKARLSKPPDSTRKSAQRAASQTDVDEHCIDTIRTLSVDAVQQANSGHPGTPMAFSSAPLKDLLKKFGFTQTN